MPTTSYTIFPPTLSNLFCSCLQSNQDETESHKDHLINNTLSALKLSIDGDIKEYNISELKLIDKTDRIESNDAEKKSSNTTNPITVTQIKIAQYLTILIKNEDSRKKIVEKLIEAIDEKDEKDSPSFIAEIIISRNN